MARLTFDIETDGLLDKLTKVHSLCIEDVDTGEAWSCTDNKGYVSPDGYTVTSIREGLRMLVEADKVIGHNIIKFDIPAIQKVEPWFDIKRSQITDTLILSRVIWPDIRERDFELRNSKKRRIEIRAKQLGVEADDKQQWVKDQLNLVLPGQLIGSHGLEAWGYRLGEWKGDYSKEMKAKGLDPWAEWNPSMQAYCEQDIVVTTKLFRRIESKGYSKKAIKIEHDFAVILAEMETNGFPFHMANALDLQRRLMRRQAEIHAELKKSFEPIIERWTFTPKANNSRYGYVKGQPKEMTREVVFNPSSRQHIARWLKHKYGWKPEEYTDKGQPVVDEKVLKSLDYPEANLLAESFLLDKRLGMLEGQGGNGLIPYSVKGTDGVWRIHGSVNTCGAVTRRCTHSKPNMAQIPATSVPFGKDFRELMYAPEGWSLLGWDASGLELRCFAHYMAAFDGGAYADIVLSGDIHWAHAKALGLVGEHEEFDHDNETHQWARNKVAKRFIYAFLYGAGSEKIGEIVCPQGTQAEKVRQGKKLITTFLKKTPALKKLKDRIKKAVEKKGYLLAIDGGKMQVRSEHAALNTLLQSAGAIAVKVATILFYDKLIEKGFVPGRDFMLVAHVHDEVQTLVKKGLEEVVGETAKEAMRDTGEALGFKCPLSADYDVGASWADTH